MNKSKMVRVRVSPLEKAALAAIAGHEGRKPTEALRELIREAARQRGLWPPVLYMPMIAESQSGPPDDR